MNKLALLCALALASCTTASPAVEPIPGSITYGGQPRTKLTKSPIGSTLSHDFSMGDGRRAYETYRIAPDRSLILLNRVIMSDVPPDR
ncbi:hypothetical protein RRU01S_03_00620 [Agrobacterium rubi TR3 = NBRC 13261]|uniref:Transmembrane protein n=1 Tax=Agrobacterium rubi TR3 = NBRC 13261 TaxID=1368415 RepID=A0A081CQE9_9HYPH|nr:hypothetical protein [Agrobacterium rubi]MBP1877302.1 hypothetical protein [Agrobacterium rubi]MCL6651484.1 hypothetical protein [Agrobacterium rubi]GAK68895.1 hypothetical protein RRU01S_03_00620 [Agrobacterium rubi TR3 = NBRC 13261]